MTYLYLNDKLFGLNTHYLTQNVLIQLKLFKHINKSKIKTIEKMSLLMKAQIIWTETGWQLT